MITILAICIILIIIFVVYSLEAFLDTVSLKYLYEWKFSRFFYKNLFASMYIVYFIAKEKKDKTRGNDRFNFDAKRIKVLPPVMNFLRQLSEKFRCTVSNAVVTPGRKLLYLKIFIGR